MSLALSSSILRRKCLHTVICTSTKMTVASRAVMMAVMMVAVATEVEQEGQSLHSGHSVGVAGSDVVVSGRTCVCASGVFSVVASASVPVIQSIVYVV